jgi:hypothetical protein
MCVGTVPCMVADGAWSMTAAEGRGQQGCRVVCLMVYGVCPGGRGFTRVFWNRA